VKAILEFTLPEDQEEFRTASDAPKYRAVVEYIFAYLRGRIKYGQMPSRAREALEVVRGELLSIMRDRGVDLDG